MDANHDIVIGDPQGTDAVMPRRRREERGRTVSLSTITEIIPNGINDLMFWVSLAPGTFSVSDLILRHRPTLLQSHPTEEDDREYFFPVFEVHQFALAGCLVEMNEVGRLRRAWWQV
ncbi:hypothetical protein MMC25_008071 [Agyrium rufum]|nr:hypothetical protein [Agyrium rufum]